MTHQFRPSIDSLETKNLLSHVTVGMIGPQLPIGAPGGIGTPITPIIGMPISPVVGQPGPTAVGTPAPPISTPVPDLETSLTTNQTVYAPGQVVKMTFTMTNDTGHTVLVPIGPSIDGFSVTLGGRTIWRSNSGPQPFVIALEKLAPGQSMTLTAAWFAPPLSGTFVVHNQLDPTDTAAFEISTSPPVPPVASRVG